MHEILRVAEVNNGVATLDYMVYDEKGDYSLATCEISPNDLGGIPSTGYPRLSKESQAILDGLIPVQLQPEESATQIYKDFRAGLSQWGCIDEKYNNLDERTLVVGFNALMNLIDKKYIEGAIKILCPEKHN